MNDTSDDDLEDSSVTPKGPILPVSWRHILLLLLTAFLAAVLATDRAQVPNGDGLRSGEIAPRTVKAPFSFTFQDLQGWEQARTEAGAAAREIWRVSEDLADKQVQQLVDVFEQGRQALDGRPGAALSADERLAVAQEVIEASSLASLTAEDLEPLVVAGFPARAEARGLAWLEKVYSRDRWVVGSDDRPQGDRDVAIDQGDGSLVVASPPQIVTVEDVRAELTLESLQERRAAPWSATVLELARELVEPNLSFDEAATRSARQVAEAEVVPAAVRVQRGETLFREGDPLTELDVAKYRALQHSRSDHGVALGLLSRFALNAMALLLLYGAGNTLRMQRFGENPNRVLAAWAAVMLMSLALLRLVVAVAPGAAQMIGNDVQAPEVWLSAPILGGVLLVSELMGVRRALSWVLSVVVPASLIVGLHASFVLWLVVSGVAAVALSSSTRERMDVLKAGLQVGAIGGALMVLMHFVTLYSAEGELSLATTIRPLWAMIFALVGGILSGFFVLGLVPVFERFGFVTDHRMMELASLNHPVMRELMLRAPGTYHHSVVVGSLAEAACERIGANGTQAKIAAYFHDIGKIDKPTFFVENQQGGANRHGDLDPVTSAEIIIDHVHRGARMARKHKLPQPIIDNIQMHHGTGLLQFFFAKAQMQADDPSQVDEADFRYPGPLPNNREAGVIMLADKVEAATRSIKDPTEDAIRAMIQRIVNSVMADSQFAQCPLTFREIHEVVDVFVNVLMGIHHQRVVYPGQNEGVSQRRTERPERPERAKMAIGQGAPGTITLELEASKELVREGRWRDNREDTTDYESVRNLPHGRR